MKIARYISLLVLFMMPVVAAWGAGSVEMRVEMPRGSRSIGVGDEFHLTINVSNINTSPEAPKNFPGAKLMYFDRTGQSSRFESYNGHTTQSFTYTYTATLRATKEGTYSYGPITVGNARSNKVTYTIGAKGASVDQGAAAQGNPGNARQGDPGKPQFIGKGDNQLYLKASVSRSSAYEQEALVYTVKLYTTYSAIKFIGATSAPKFEGFVVEESKERSTQFEYETVNGKTYATAVIAKYIIFPQMPGKLKVIGNTYTVSVDQREYYHDPIFGSLSYSTPLQLNITPNDLQVDVKSLPLPKPADFSGAVGSFSISSSLPATSFLSNQASSVVYTVTGQGNLKYVKLPDLNQLYPPQLEVYSPTTDVKADVTSSNVSGSVKFDYSFMPLESGQFKIPEVTLCYFNPATATYERSVAKGYTIEVGKGKGSSKSQTRMKLSFDPKLMKVPDSVSGSYYPAVYGFWYWLWYIVPVLLLGGVGFYYRSYLKAHADMVAFRSRKAGKVARARLKKAAQCLRRGDADNFYNVMLESIWGYLGDKLKIPLSDLSRDNVREKLSAHQIDDQVITSLVNILDECEYARYAPSAGASNMAKVYDDAVDAIDSVERQYDSRPAQNEDESVNRLDKKEEI